MTFRFNFEESEKLNEVTKPSNIQTESDDDGKSELNDCNIISIEDLKLKVESDKVKIIKCGVYELKYITQELVSDDSVNVLDELKSDLLPGKYEGGLKVWECSIDLMQFLANGNYISPNDSVLELGCGVGLPGLLSYLCGASVTFQDYNSKVLELITIPNVILNTTNQDREKVSKHCQFISGDWGGIQEKFFSKSKEKTLYDIVITSETIYNKSSQKKLLTLMKSTLKPDGVVFLASKVHYFGVGGGITDFEQLLKNDKTFSFSTVYKTTEGVERQILKLTFKNGEGAV